MILEYPNIVIGSDLRAMLFAFMNGYPIFFTEARKPHEFESLKLTHDLSFLDIDNEPSVYKSFNSEYSFGQKQVLAWEKIFFLLSFEGLVPLSNICDSIRYDGNTLTCATEYAKLCEIKFDKCFYFGDNRTYKLVTERNIKNARYKVFDTIGFNTGGKHEIDYYRSDDNFVREVWFYSSYRICGDTGVKDACVLSILTSEQLNDPSYTQTITNFKLLDVLGKNGLKGRVYGYNKKGESLHRKIKTHSAGRIKTLLDQPDWQETEKVKRVNDSLDTLIMNCKNMKFTNYSYLR
tara:strand:+ start:2300 stop:3175 length:876 start_codon:yes stop_codon:yes gene_type:complete